MQRIDNSTASTTLPTPKQPGQPGFFTAGTIGGVAATIVEADWLNNVQEELINVIAAAALTPNKLDNTQVITAIMTLIANNTRRRLTADLDLYVSTTGNDANNGFTPATAFATLQAAWNYIMQRLDCGGHTIRINIAHGTYAPVWCYGGALGLGTVELLGDVTNPAAVSIVSSQPQIAAIGVFASLVGVSGVHLQTNGDAFSTCLGVTAAGTAVINGPVIFGPSTGAHISSILGSTVQIQQSYTINGGAPEHYNAGGGNISTPAVMSQTTTVNVVGTPNFTTAFAECTNNGQIDMTVSQFSFSGGATGSRYNAQTGGQILAYGGGANYFPGNAAGTADATSFGHYTG